MPMQFDHERLAEAHHFQIGATLRVEIAAAFGAADRQARQCVLEYLLESQELDGSQQDRRMTPQADLIRASCRVELHSKTEIDPYMAFIVGPLDPENDPYLAF